MELTCWRQLTASQAAPGTSMWNTTTSGTPTIKDSLKSSRSRPSTSVETTWRKEWYAYLSSTTISWCSCGKTTVVDEWSVIRLSTECCLSETVVRQSSGEYRVICSWDVVILLLYRKGRNMFEWMSRGRVKVIKWFLSVLRTEVSRHFKVIRVLGFFLGRADSDVPTLGDQRGMMGNKQHCLGSYANNA
jgi:hypothetical protein